MTPLPLRLQWLAQGVETLAVVIVDDEDPLALADVGSLRGSLVDRDASDIIKIRLSDSHAVNLRFHHFYKHVSTIFWKTIGNIVDKANLSAIDRDASDNPGDSSHSSTAASSGVDYFEIFHLHLVDGIDFLHDHCMGLLTECSLLKATLSASAKHG